MIYHATLVLWVYRILHCAHIKHTMTGASIHRYRSRSSQLAAFKPITREQLPTSRNILGRTEYRRNGSVPGDRIWMPRFEVLEFRLANFRGGRGTCSFH